VGWDPDRQRSFFDTDDPAITVGFYDAMHALSTPAAQALARLIDFRNYHRLLDLSGGSAAFDIELCRAFPDLQATVFDLPGVVEFAASKIAAAGLSDRITNQAGDLFDDDSYPPGHDLALLSLILHAFTEERDREILRKSLHAVARGGALLISELLVDDDKTGPAPAALMSLTMPVEDEGRNYTGAEYTRWLTDAGFTDIQRLPIDAPGANGILLAHKP
jgi:3-hydroxy-5-methyl-1-naphthoate 3-O-methyltransferase